jgi:DNA mismatch endonuclease (patch repair protein)
VSRHETKTPPAVSRRMASVRRRNTDPEMTLRRALRGIGIRFRVHDRRLPGTPDIVLQKRRVAIFVHGCFWHRHRGCSRATLPKTNVGFWLAKFDDNVRRDARKARVLRSAGWSVCTVWECKLHQDDRAEARRVLTVRRRRLAAANRIDPMPN